MPATGWFELVVGDEDSALSSFIRDPQSPGLVGEAGNAHSARLPQTLAAYQVAPVEPPPLPCHLRDLMHTTALRPGVEENRAGWQRPSQSATDPRPLRVRQHSCSRRSGSVRY